MLTRVNSSLICTDVYLCESAANLVICLSTHSLTHSLLFAPFPTPQFHDFSIEIEELVHHEARNVFLTVHSMSSTITSYALDSNAEWPYVSIPHWEVRGLEMNNLSNSILMGFSPYVNAFDKDAWEVYANHMQGWVHEGVEYNYDLHKDYLNGSHVIDPIPEEIYRYGNDSSMIPETGSGVLLPVWQLAPAPHDPQVINYNLLDNEVFERVEHGMHAIKLPVLSEVTDLEFLYGGSVYDDPTHPHSFLLQPVYHDFIHHSEADILGVVTAIIGWDHYFENLLPPEAHGIVVVMKDTCGDVFSYQINGAEAVFLGYEDYHETKYTHLEEKSFFDPLHKLEVSDTHEHCEYDLFIYPSQELEDDYTTNKPIIYTVVVLSVFITTVLVFVLYDYFVAARNKKVTLAAKKSNAVVASLFPKNVRDRIMQDVEEQLAAGQKVGGRKSVMFGAVAKHELKNFLDDGVANADVTPFDTKPIADLFPSTTISEFCVLLCSK